MMTRRQLLTAAGLTAAVALVGCDDKTAKTSAGTPKGVPDVLLVDVSGGLTAVRGAVVAPALAAAVPSLDGLRLFAAEADGANTTLRTIDARTGNVVGTAQVAGRWVPRAASSDGEMVALTAPPQAGASPFLPAGRERTGILLAAPEGELWRLDLAGNLVPDALASSKEGLFVLDWLPPTTPDRYRVRYLDFAGRSVKPLNTVAKSPVPTGAEEEMRGEGRLAVYSPHDTMLFTLYTHQPGHQHTRDLIAGRPGGVHAFVHSLHLTQAWAYCVDLPAPFGESDGASHTIAIDPTGHWVYVIDAAAGRLAVIDAANLAIGNPLPPQVVTIPKATGTAYAAASRTKIFMSNGAGVRVFSPDGTGSMTWPVGGEVRGLAVNEDGTRLYVGHPGRVTLLDAESGATLGGVDVPDLTVLRRVVSP